MSRPTPETPVRYEPARPASTQETFVVLSGTLTIYLGETPEAVEVPTGGVIRVGPGTPLQSANHGREDLVVFAYGTPPETESAELLPPPSEGGIAPAGRSIVLRAMPEHLSPALKAVSDAVLAVASELSVEQVLQRLVDSRPRAGRGTLRGAGDPGRDGRLSDAFSSRA